jgi:hypothetical protein
MRKVDVEQDGPSLARGDVFVARVENGFASRSTRNVGQVDEYAVVASLQWLVGMLVHALITAAICHEAADEFEVCA